MKSPSAEGGLTGAQLSLAGIISNEIHHWLEDHEDDPTPMTNADDEAEIWELSKHLATVMDRLTSSSVSGER